MLPFAPRVMQRLLVGITTTSLVACRQVVPMRQWRLVGLSITVQPVLRITVSLKVSCYILSLQISSKLFIYIAPCFLGSRKISSGVLKSQQELTAFFLRLKMRNKLPNLGSGLLRVANVIYRTKLRRWKPKFLRLHRQACWSAKVREH